MERSRRQPKRGCKQTAANNTAAAPAITVPTCKCACVHAIPEKHAGLSVRVDSVCANFRIRIAICDESVLQASFCTEVRIANRDVAKLVDHKLYREYPPVNKLLSALEDGPKPGLSSAWLEQTIYDTLIAIYGSIPRAWVQLCQSLPRDTGEIVLVPVGQRPIERDPFVRMVPSLWNLFDSSCIGASAFEAQLPLVVRICPNCV